MSQIKPFDLESFLAILEWSLHRRGVLRKTIETSAGPIGYHTYGEGNVDGKRIVLVHGLGNSSLTWMKSYRFLGKSHVVRAVDLPGFGQTPLPEGRTYASVTQMRDALIAFLERFRDGPVVLVGQSLGGWVSAKVAAARPDLVSRLVLVNNAGILYPQIHELKEMMLVTSAEEVRAFWRRMWHRIPLINHVFVDDYIRRMGVPQIKEFLSSIGPDDFLNDDLHRLQVPVSIIWGESDRFIPRGSVDIMLRELPETRVYWIPRCGHIPQVEAPRLFNRFLLGALESPTPVQPGS